MARCAGCTPASTRTTRTAAAAGTAASWSTSPSARRSSAVSTRKTRSRGSSANHNRCRRALPRLLGGARREARLGFRRRMDARPRSRRAARGGRVAGGSRRRHHVCGGDARPRVLERRGASRARVGERRDRLDRRRREGWSFRSRRRRGGGRRTARRGRFPDPCPRRIPGRRSSSGAATCVLPMRRSASCSTSIGTQIGQFIDRRRSRRASSREELRARDRQPPLADVLRHARRRPADPGAHRRGDEARRRADGHVLLPRARRGGVQELHFEIGSFARRPRARRARGRRASRSGSSRATVRCASTTSAPRAGRRASKVSSAGTAVASYLAVPVVSRGGRILGGIALSHAEPGCLHQARGAHRLRHRRPRRGGARRTPSSTRPSGARERRPKRRAAPRTSSWQCSGTSCAIRSARSATASRRSRCRKRAAATAPGPCSARSSLVRRIRLAQLVDDLLDVTRLISGKVRLRTRVARPAGARQPDPRIAARRRQGFAPLRALPGRAGIRRRRSGAPRADRHQPRGKRASSTRPRAARSRSPSSEAGEDAQLRVRDNGQGIEPDLLPRIFDLFVQGKQSLDRPRGRPRHRSHAGAPARRDARRVGRGGERGRREREASSGFAFRPSPTNEAAVTESAPEAGARHPAPRTDRGGSLRFAGIAAAVARGLGAPGRRVARNGDEAVELALARSAGDRPHRHRSAGARWLRRGARDPRGGFDRRRLPRRPDRLWSAARSSPRARVGIQRAPGEAAQSREDVASDGERRGLRRTPARSSSPRSATSGWCSERRGVETLRVLAKLRAKVGVSDREHLADPLAQALAAQPGDALALLRPRRRSHDGPSASSRAEAPRRREASDRRAGAARTAARSPSLRPRSTR